MTPDEIVHIVHVAGQKQLLPVQELILHQSWKGETYATMAEEFHYDAAYLKKVAFELWHLLSDIFQTPISKANLRSILGSHPLTLQQQQLLSSTSLSPFPPKICSDCQFPGGVVPSGSKFYINHGELETLAHQEVTRPGGLVRIKGPSKIGKSSFLIRVLDFAIAQNYRTAYIDFREVHHSLLSTPANFLRWFCTYTSHLLDIQTSLDDYWDDEIGAGPSCTLYFKQHLLKQDQHPLILILDDVDCIGENTELAQTFFPMLRSWHEKAKRVPLMQQLRIAVGYCTDFKETLSLDASLFNVGLPLKLPWLTLGQIQQLAGQYQFDWTDDKADVQWLTALKSMTGGHPYLVQLAFYHLCRGGLALEQLLKAAPTLAGIYGNHLRNYLVIFKTRPDLAASFKQVLTTEKEICHDPVLAYELNDMGLVQLQGNQIIPSCDLYRMYFSAQF